jgi:hypothetical protein
MDNDDKQRIYEEEKVRQEAKDKIKADKKKQGCIGCLVIIVLLVIIGLIVESCSGEKPTSTQGNSPTTSSNQGTISWATADITEDNIKLALSGKAPADPISKDSDFHKNLTKIEIIDNANKPGNKNINIFYKAGTSWDETDFVKRIGGTAIVIGSILFSNQKVEQVAIFTQTEMTDKYGKTSLETGTKIVLSRNTANKIDWKGISERHITDPGNIYRIADDYKIHPGILKNVKLDKVQLR